MKSSVTPAVTTPSATPARSASRLKAEGRGLTTTSSSTPAQNSRNHAAPPAPTWSIRPTEAARPSWTQNMDATAMEAPVRAGECDMSPVNPGNSIRST